MICQWEDDMFQLDLNQDESKILIEVLEHELSELRMEIADTDSQDFRQTLKNKKEVVTKALQSLQQSSE